MVHADHSQPITSIFYCTRSREAGAMSASNLPGAAAAEAAADGGTVERRTIPRIFVSECTLRAPGPSSLACRWEKACRFCMI